MIKKTLKTGTKYLSYLFVFCIIIILLLGYTKTGLHISLFIAKKTVPGHLTVKKATGRLLSQFTLNECHYTDEKTVVSIPELTLFWQPLNLLRGLLDIRQLHTKGITVNVNSHQKTKTNPTKNTGHDFSLPLDFKLQEVSISDTDLIVNKQNYTLKKIVLNASISKNEISVSHLLFSGIGQHITGSINIPFRKLAKAHGSLVAKGHVEGFFNLHSNESNTLSINSRITKPYHLKLEGQITNIYQKKNINMTLSWQSLFYPLTGEKQIDAQQGHLQLRTNQTLYQLNLETHLKHASLPKANIKVHIEGNLQAIKTSAIDITALGGQLHANSQLQFTPFIAWDSRIQASNMHLSPFIKGSNINLNLHTKGQWDKKEPQFNLHVKEITGTLFNKPLMAKVRLNYPKTCQATVKLGSNHLTVNGSFPLPLKINGVFDDFSHTTGALNGLQTSIKINALFDKKASANMTINKGNYKLTNGQILSFKGGRLDATFNKNSLLANSLLQLDSNKTLSLSLKASDVLPLHLKTQRVLLKSQLNINSISFIDKLLAPTISKSNGHLKANLTIHGSLQKPDIKTKIALKNFKTTITPLKINLQSPNINIQGNDHTWQVQGHLYSGDGSVQVKGQASLKNKILYSQLLLNGHDFLIINNNDYQATVSPNLTIKSDKENLNIFGRILIPKAKLSPERFSSAETLPDDIVIIKNKKEKKASSLKLDVHLNTELGDAVFVDSNGLNGQLSGQLQLSMPKGQAMRATGSLTIKHGKYNAYGQKLSIDKGIVQFTGGLITNPNIELRATRSFKRMSQFGVNNNQPLDAEQLNYNSFSRKIIVGIVVTGRLRSPNVKLFSIPANFSQADILSMLIVGRPLDQASGSGGQSQLLLGALSQLNLGGGNEGKQLTNQLQHALGADSLGIETVSTYNASENKMTDTTALMMQKKISSRLSLNYGVGIDQAGYLLRIKYLINKKWTLQIETDNNANGMDIIYNYHN